MFARRSLFVSDVHVGKAVGDSWLDLSSKTP